MLGDLIRSTIFNVLFYMLTAAACVACLPTLFLPRKYFMGVVHSFVGSIYFLERAVLGLKLEVRGAENLPESGAYILAAKHQSAYETFKLHLLFKDPAVILKKELLSIPLWGKYLKKSDPIAIDRKDGKGATHSVQEGAKRVAAQGRPIVIFPQGTRVSVTQTSSERPYKPGVAKMQEATGLPIIPLAINAGVFWPKHKWIKRKGTVIFSFLPAIEAGQERGAVMKELEERVEAESLSLINEGREQIALRGGSSKAGVIAAVVMAALLFGFYSFAWFEVAKRTKAEYVAMLGNFTGGRQVYETPEITGYPGKMRLFVAEETVQTDRGSVFIKDLRVEGWPLPFVPIEVKTGNVGINYFRWKEPLIFDSLEGFVTFERTELNIRESILRMGEFEAELEGTIDAQARPAPAIDTIVTVVRPMPLLLALSNAGAIKPEMAMMLGAGLNGFKDAEGKVRVPVYQRDMKLFAGPIPVWTYAPPIEYDRELGVRLRPIP